MIITALRLGQVLLSQVRQCQLSTKRDLKQQKCRQHQFGVRKSRSPKQLKNFVIKIGQLELKQARSKKTVTSKRIGESVRIFFRFRFSVARFFGQLFRGAGFEVRIGSVVVSQISIEKKGPERASSDRNFLFDDGRASSASSSSPLIENDADQLYSDSTSTQA